MGVFAAGLGLMVLRPLAALADLAGGWRPSTLARPVGFWPHTRWGTIDIY